MSNETNQSSLGRDLLDARLKVKAFWSSIFGERKNYDEIAYFRNPDSIWDEVLLLCWIALMVATGFTVYYGFRYHYAIFSTAGGNEGEALAVSAAVFILGEILKIFFGHRFFRTVFTGSFTRGLPQFVLVICLGLIFYKAVVWSIDISAKGYGMVNASKATQEAIAGQTDYTTLTKSIDDQIAIINTNAAKGASVTWHGKITEEGQDIMKRNAKVVQKLLDQKNAMVAIAMQRDSQMLSAKGVDIAAKQARQNDYGGKAEYVVVFVLFMIGLMELVNYRNNKHLFKEPEKTKKEPESGFRRWFSLRPAPAVASAKENTKSDAPTRPIGFKRYDDADSTPKQEAEKCSYTSYTVATDDKEENSLRLDQLKKLLKSKKSELDAEIANYSTRNGTLDTIRGRIQAKYTDLVQFITDNDVLEKEVEKIGLWDWKEAFIVPILNGASPESINKKGYKGGNRK